MRHIPFVLPLVGLLLAACGDSTQAPVVVSVAMSPDSTDLGVGEMVTFEATPLDGAGNPVTGQVVQWTINDPTVATLSTSGTATGIDPGFALVHATVNGVVGQAKLLVVPGPPASLVLQPQSTVLDPDATRRFEATLRDVGGNLLTGIAVTWTSTNTAAGTIPAPGVLQAGAAGATMVIASADGVADTAVATVVPIAFVSTGAGSQHGCSSSVGLAVYCWGSATNGVLGTGTTSGTTTTPTRALTGAELVGVVAGPVHTCALERGGSVLCWGRNNRGQVGDGTTTTRSAPSTVPASIGFASVAVGGEHTCALSTAGRAWCWGRNNVGQIGQAIDPEPGPGVPAPVHPLPELVNLGPSAYVKITAGQNHTCGLTATGAAHCWGEGTEGALGSGDSTNTGAPVAVAGGLVFQDISAGQFHTCGVTTGGAAYCWGSGADGQLGTGGTRHLTPTAVQGGLTFTAISAGAGHTCALDGANAAWCWGDGTYGQLGTGVSGIASDTPLAVTGGLKFTAIAAGTGPLTCAVTSEPAAYCWGRNNVGQLGDTTIMDRSAPTRVARQ